MKPARIDHPNTIFPSSSRNRRISRTGDVEATLEEIKEWLGILSSLADQFYHMQEKYSEILEDTRVVKDKIDDVSEKLNQNLLRLTATQRSQFDHHVKHMMFCPLFASLQTIVKHRQASIVKCFDDPLFTLLLEEFSLQMSDNKECGDDLETSLEQSSGTRQNSETMSPVSSSQLPTTTTDIPVVPSDSPVLAEATDSFIPDGVSCDNIVGTTEEHGSLCVVEPAMLAVNEDVLSDPENKSIAYPTLSVIHADTSNNNHEEEATKHTVAGLLDVFATEIKQRENGVRLKSRSRSPSTEAVNSSRNRKRRRSRGISSSSKGRSRTRSRTRSKSRSRSVDRESQRGSTMSPVRQSGQTIESGLQTETDEENFLDEIHDFYREVFPPKKAREIKDLFRDRRRMRTLARREEDAQTVQVAEEARTAVANALRSSDSSELISNLLIVKSKSPLPPRRRKRSDSCELEGSDETPDCFVHHEGSLPTCATKSSSSAASLNRKLCINISKTSLEKIEKREGKAALKLGEKEKWQCAIIELPPTPAPVVLKECEKIQQGPRTPPGEPCEPVHVEDIVTPISQLPLPESNQVFMPSFLDATVPNGNSLISIVASSVRPRLPLLHPIPCSNSSPIPSVVPPIVSPIPPPPPPKGSKKSCPSSAYLHQHDFEWNHPHSEYAGQHGSYYPSTYSSSVQQQHHMYQGMYYGRESIDYPPLAPPPPPPHSHHTRGSMRGRGRNRWHGRNGKY